ncbi:MAG: hypothetical protein IH984_02580 [Planctomycetes bacterium]|nr:hypothetical protein [Planctomycetota bacterium]
MDNNSIETPPAVKSQFIQLQELGVSFDADGRLDEDVVCRSCEYNLRSLTLQDKCPECDTPIKLSLQTSLLRFSDLAWIKRVRSGITFMIVYVSIYILYFASWDLYSILGGTVFQRTPAVRIVFSIVILVLQIIAILRITKLEPGWQKTNSKVTARKLARICLLLAAVIGTFSSNPQWFIYFIPYITLILALSMWVGLFSTLALFIGKFALFYYGRSIAQRFPSEKLAKTTYLVMWGYLAPSMISPLISYAARFTSHYEIFNIYTSELYTSFNLIRYFMAILFAIFCIWGLVLLFKYRSQFTKAMKLAT